MKSSCNRSISSPPARPIHFSHLLLTIWNEFSWASKLSTLDSSYSAISRPGWSEISHKSFMENWKGAMLMKSGQSWILINNKFGVCLISSKIFGSKVPMAILSLHKLLSAQYCNFRFDLTECEKSPSKFSLISMINGLL